MATRGAGNHNAIAYIGEPCPDRAIGDGAADGRGVGAVGAYAICVAGAKAQEAPPPQDHRDGSSNMMSRMCGSSVG